MPEPAQPPLVAAFPEADGQPPKPVDSPKLDAPTATATARDVKLPPPVVNPEDEPGPVPSQPPAEGQAKPQPQPNLPPPVPNPESDLSRTGSRSTSLRFVSTSAAVEAHADSASDGSETSAPAPRKDAPNAMMIALSILMAALCWGSYGPMLHQGQMKMGGSRLRPFACVGIAYFIIAVAVPLVLLSTTPTISHGAWTVTGLFWSIIAGGAGALGALGIILAFNAGGKPIYVMPLVFGFAPVINTFISLTEAGAWSRVEVWFWASLGVVIAGAITVLTTAPKAAHGPAHPAPAK